MNAEILLVILVLWYVALRHWVFGLWRFEGRPLTVPIYHCTISCIDRSSWTAQLWRWTHCRPLKHYKALTWSQCHFLQDLNLQHCHLRTSNLTESVLHWVTDDASYIVKSSPSFKLFQHWLLLCSCARRACAAILLCTESVCCSIVVQLCTESVCYNIVVHGERVLQYRVFSLCRAWTINF